MYTTIFQYEIQISQKNPTDLNSTSTKEKLVKFSRRSEKLFCNLSVCNSWRIEFVKNLFTWFNSFKFITSLWQTLKKYSISWDSADKYCIFLIGILKPIFINIDTWISSWGMLVKSWLAILTSEFNIFSKYWLLVYFITYVWQISLQYLSPFLHYNWTSSVQMILLGRTLITVIFRLFTDFPRINFACYRCSKRVTNCVVCLKWVN